MIKITDKEMKLMMRRTGKTQASLILFFKEISEKFNEELSINNKDFPYKRSD